MPENRAGLVTAAGAADTGSGGDAGRRSADRDVDPCRDSLAAAPCRACAGIDCRCRAGGMRLRDASAVSPTRWPSRRCLAFPAARRWARPCWLSVAWQQLADAAGGVCRRAAGHCAGNGAGFAAPAGIVAAGGVAINALCGNLLAWCITLPLPMSCAASFSGAWAVSPRPAGRSWHWLRRCCCW